MFLDFFLSDFQFYGIILVTTNKSMFPLDCIFCQIIEGKTNTPILYRDDRVTVFPDLHPITPVHILIVPNEHIPSANHLKPEQESLVGHMVSVAQTLAHQNLVDQTGYRLVINTGADAGQSVFHLHMHLIGGRHMPFKFNP
jgi:histidine triad (HIT) family protein